LDLEKYLSQVRTEMDEVAKLNPQTGENVDLSWLSRLKERVQEGLGFYDSNLLILGIDSNRVREFFETSDYSIPNPNEYFHRKGGVFTLRNSRDNSSEFLVTSGNGCEIGGNTLFHSLNAQLIGIESIHERAKLQKIPLRYTAVFGEEIAVYSPENK